MRSVLKVVSKCLSEKFYLKANRGLSLSSHLKLNRIVRETQSSKINILTLKPVFPTLRHMGTYITIRHSHKKFSIEVDGKEAWLAYSIVNGVMHIKSTLVPKEMGGHGLGKLLAKEALEYAVKNGLALKISCDFVQYYIDEYEPYYLKYIA